MDLGLNGRVVIVTGGASNIGKATSIAFAAEAATVAILDREAAGDRVDRTLGGAVGGEARHADHRLCGRDVHDAAAAMRCGMPYLHAQKTLPVRVPVMMRSHSSVV